MPSSCRGPSAQRTVSRGHRAPRACKGCHAVVHWNCPPNPVDFEQREGCVCRYKGHAIRRNVSATHRADALGATGDPWSAAFAAAAAQRPSGVSQVFPDSVYPEASSVERHVPLLPLSRDHRRYERVRDALTVYRLAFGQPNQEDLAQLLIDRGVTGPGGKYSLIDLTPPTSRRFE